MTAEHAVTDYRITVSGCDDSTVVRMGLTAAEFAVAERIADAVTQASDYGCQPRMSIGVNGGDEE